MMDEIDIAQHHAEEWERINERARLARMANELQALNVKECEECGAEIGAARKRILPTAKLCIDCAEIKERRNAAYMR